MAKILPPNNNNNKSNKYNFFSGGNMERAETADAFLGMLGGGGAEPEGWQYNPNIAMQPESMAVSIPVADIDEAPEEWNFFPLPDLETLRAIAKSIYTQGQLSPCIVWERENGRFMMLGGHTRLKTFKFLAEMYPDEKDRFSTIICHVYGKHQLSEEEARFIIISSNMTQRAKESAALRIRSVCEAMELQKSLTVRKWGEQSEHARDILAKSFNISPRNIDRIYSLRKLIPQLVAKMEDGSLTANTALAVAKLPENLQEEFCNAEMYKHKLTAQQLKEIAASTTPEEMSAAIAMESYSAPIPPINTSFPIPKKFKKVGLAVDPEDYDKIRNAFATMLESMDFANEDTKRAIRASFDLA